MTVINKIPSYLMDKMLEHVIISDDMKHLVLKFRNLICPIEVSTSNINYDMKTNGIDSKFDSCSIKDAGKIYLNDEVVFTIPIPDIFPLDRELNFKIKIGVYNISSSIDWILIAEFNRTPV